MLAVGGGCSPAPQEPEAADPVVRPNIVIFLIDTLRADRIGAYGYSEAPTSPRIDALAGEAVLFEQAYAPSPWTLPSVASIFSATFICEHGVIHDRHRLAEEYETLAERLRSGGYRTLGLTGNPYVGADFGLDQGFDDLRFSRRNDAKKVAPVLDRAGDGPFFIYIHNMEPHGGERYLGPRQPGFPEVEKPLREELLETFRAYRRLTRVDFAARREPGVTDNSAEQRALMADLDRRLETNNHLYDAAVRLADERLGSVIDLLSDRGLWENTLFVVVSDHGEELSDHGGWQHDQSVYEELVRVPLILKLPGKQSISARVAEPVSLVDLAPTILAVAGLEPELNNASGIPLTARIDGIGDTGAPVVPALRINRKKYYRPWKDARGDINIVVREGEFKAIWNAEFDRTELYDLNTDPRESNDLAAIDPDLADRLAERAKTWLAACGTGGRSETSGLTDDTRERLRALGYVE